MASRLHVLPVGGGTRTRGLVRSAGARFMRRLRLRSCAFCWHQQQQCVRCSGPREIEFAIQAEEENTARGELLEACTGTFRLIQKQV
jgi:hypothetical protein